MYEEEEDEEERSIRHTWQRADPASATITTAAPSPLPLTTFPLPSASSTQSASECPPLAKLDNGNIQDAKSSLREADSLSLSISSGAGQNVVSLNLLRKALHKHESPDDLIALLLAAKICSEDSLFAVENVGYAQ